MCENVYLVLKNARAVRPSKAGSGPLTVATA